MSERTVIKELIGDEALWMQLAEEASELSQAAAKMARLIHGTNPLAGSNEKDYKTLETELCSHVDEELADVALCAQELGLDIHHEIVRMKKNRWITRCLNDRYGRPHESEKAPQEV